MMLNKRIIRCYGVGVTISAPHCILWYFLKAKKWHNLPSNVSHFNVKFRSGKNVISNQITHGYNITKESIVKVIRKCIVPLVTHKAFWINPMCKAKLLVSFAKQDQFKTDFHTAVRGCSQCGKHWVFSIEYSWADH